MLRISGLKHSYAGKKALDLPSFQLASGEQGLLLGPSGSGKTTLLHLLCGLIRPQEGKIQILDQDLSALSGAAMDKFRGNQLSLVPQRLHLIGAISALDNVLMAQYLAGQTQTPDTARTLLSSLGLEGKEKKRPSQLSQGEAQRVAIARAVINRPSLILADEPTSALDEENALKVGRLLQEQAKACGAGLLIATHDHRLQTLFPILKNLGEAS